MILAPITIFKRLTSFQPHYNSTISVNRVLSSPSNFPVIISYGIYIPTNAELVFFDKNSYPSTKPISFTVTCRSIFVSQPNLAPIMLQSEIFMLMKVAASCLKSPRSSSGLYSPPHISKGQSLGGTLSLVSKSESTASTAITSLHVGKGSARLEDRLSHIEVSACFITFHPKLKCDYFPDLSSTFKDWQLKHLSSRLKSQEFIRRPKQPKHSFRKGHLKVFDLLFSTLTPRARDNMELIWYS